MISCSSEGSKKPRRRRRFSSFPVPSTRGHQSRGSEGIISILYILHCRAGFRMFEREEVSEFRGLLESWEVRLSVLGGLYLRLVGMAN